MKNNNPPENNDMPTEEAVVMALMAHHVTAHQICKYLKVSKEYFADNYSYVEQYPDFYNITRNEAVENAIFKAAVEGNAPSMISWLKNKNDWDDGKNAAQQREKDSDVPLEIKKIEVEVLTKEHKVDDGQDTEDTDDGAPG